MQRFIHDLPQLWLIHRGSELYYGGLSPWTVFSNRNLLSGLKKIIHEDTFTEDTTSITHENDLPLIGNVVRPKSKRMTYTRTQRLALTKGLNIFDTVDVLRENNTSLLNKNSRMCPVPPQGVLKGLNTCSAAAITRHPPETNQRTTGRQGGRFRWVILGSHLFRRLTSSRFSSLFFFIFFWHSYLASEIHSLSRRRLPKRLSQN